MKAICDSKPKFFFAALLILATASTQALAQPKPTALTFEVTSVKPNHSDNLRSMNAQFVGVRFSATNLPLIFLIADAYEVPIQSTRVIGLPEWTARERFDIDAKASIDVLPDDLAANDRKKRTHALLQSLLTDRFKMMIHRESKEMAFYSLTVGRSGPKLEKGLIEEKDCVENPTPSGVPCHRFNGGQGRGLHGKAVNMQDLAEFIENWTDHPVVDKTGLQGLFSVETDGWVPMRQLAQPPPASGASASPLATTVGPPSGEASMSDPTRPTLFMVLAKLGLELKIQKGPVDIFVVDHIERPTPN
jgi:uncharacterized protein (TIGR03435 family)